MPCVASDPRPRLSLAATYASLVLITTHIAPTSVLLSSSAKGFQSVLFLGSQRYDVGFASSATVTHFTERLR